MSIPRNIYAEELPTDTDLIDSTKFCPSVSMIDNYDEDGNIITKLINGVFTISGDNYRQYTGFSFEDIPRCNDFFSNSDASGCCIIKEGSDINNIMTNYKDHNMGYKYYFDISGSNNDGSYNIYHKEPVQTLFSFLDDPNKIKTFFILIIMSIFLLLVLAIIGSCYEFWLRYGNSIDCLYYIGKCKNIGDESKSGQAGKVNLIDYMFPNSIAYYPYQKCETTSSQSGGKQSSRKQSSIKQSGGGLLDSLEEKERIGFHSNYVSYKKVNGNTAKCITIDNSDFDNKGRPFPYNIADFDIQNKSIKLILKFICFFFLFPVLITRIILNKCLSYLSSGFQKNVRNNPIISNIIFAFFIGAIPVNIGGLGILSLVLGFVGSITTVVGIIMTLVLTLIPNKIGPFRKALENYNDGEVTTEYYRLLHIVDEPDGYFYRVLSDDIALKDKFKRFLLNILWFIPYLIIISLGITFGAISNLAATIYMVISTFFNFFYIPLSNSIELLDILKDHSSLLTVLLCITVVTSSAFALDGTTTSILSSLVAILILYKVVSYSKK